MLSTFRLSRLVGAALLTTMSLTLTQFSAPAEAAPGDCVGTVYRDHNANGVLDTRAAGITVSDANDPITDEPGEAGITVTAYDDIGTVVGTSVTDASGAYDLDLSVPAGTPIRIEFTWTQAWLSSGPNGPDNASSVQFTESGNCNVNFGVMNPSDYCQDNPYLATTCFDLGSHEGSDAPALAAARYDWGVPEGDFPAGSDISYTWVDAAGAASPPVKIAENQDIGTTWGQAWNRNTNNILLGAFMKANTDFGPNGPGAIYSVPTDQATGQSTGAPVLFADLAALGYEVCADPHGDDLGDTDGIPALTDATVNAVGKCAIGDMDLNYDNSILYVMNLTSREIVHLDATTGADLGSWAFPMDQNTLPAGAGFCANPATDIRPFALEEHDGKIYAGAVCSGESTAFDADKWTTAADLWTYIYEIDPATGAFTLVLEYQNKADGPNVTNFSWINSVAEIETRGTFADYGPSGDAAYQQPWLTDIEFFNNDLVLGFRDRFGDQGGSRIPHDWPGVGQRLVSFTGKGSDIACAAWDTATATYILESASTCGSRVSVDPAAGEADEFYPDGGSVGHPETSLGGLELIPGRNLTFTITNPGELLESSERIVYSAGFGWADNFDGSVERGYTFFGRGSDDPNSGDRAPLGKANGLGDVEALCGEAPLEIGNYVWYDTDGDGIQDPSEAPVLGATVNLYDSAGNVIASTVTGPNGEYYFDVDKNTGYVVRMDNPTDYAAGGPLENWVLTADSADEDDDADSDGITGTDSFPEIVYTSGGAGANDHTLDFGFYQPEFDLALFKQLADGTNLSTFALGDSVTFTLTVENQGNVDASNIEVVDYLPAGLTLSDVDWTDNGDGTASILLSGTTLAPGESTEVDISFVVAPDAAGQTIENWAEIGSAIPVNIDGNPLLYPGGAPVADVDSIADKSNDDLFETDDDVVSSGNAGGDEDDHDRAQIVVLEAASGTETTSSTETATSAGAASSTESEATTGVKKLALTGSSSRLLIQLGLTLLGFGTLVVVVERRKKAKACQQV